MNYICLNINRGSYPLPVRPDEKQIDYFTRFEFSPLLLLSGRHGILVGISERVFYSAFLPDQSKITCAEKRLIPLDRRVGIQPQNRIAFEKIQ